MGAGYIYFMQRLSGGPIKIGKTENPALRLEMLKYQTGWQDLRIRAQFWSPDIDYAEKNLHNWCEPLKVFIDYADGTRSKEWYKDTIYVRGFMYRAQRGEAMPLAFKPQWIRVSRRALCWENDIFVYFIDCNLNSEQRYRHRRPSSESLIGINLLTVDWDNL